jgi:hypothetical protein
MEGKCKHRSASCVIRQKKTEGSVAKTHSAEEEKEIESQNEKKEWERKRFYLKAERSLMEQSGW